MTKSTCNSTQERHSSGATASTWSISFRRSRGRNSKACWPDLIRNGPELKIRWPTEAAEANAGEHGHRRGVLCQHSTSTTYLMWNSTIRPAEFGPFSYCWTNPKASFNARASLFVVMFMWSWWIPNGQKHGFQMVRTGKLWLSVGVISFQKLGTLLIPSQENGM